MTDNVYPFADPKHGRRPVEFTLDPASMAAAGVRVSTLGTPSVLIHGANGDAARLILTDQQVEVDGHALADFLIHLGQQVRDQLNDWEGELERLGGGPV